VARTDADAATLLTSDIDERDKPFILDEPRTSEGFFYVRNGMEAAIARGLAYAPYADMVWCETSKPDMAQAKQFAEASMPNSPANCWPTTVRPPSTGKPTWTTPPSPNSSGNWAPWATSSSSSPWPASMP
jgi:isocitrate lyase